MFSPPRRVSDPDMHHDTWRTCRDACRDRWLAVSFEVGGGENIPGIPGARTTRNFTYVVRGPWHKCDPIIASQIDSLNKMADILQTFPGAFSWMKTFWFNIKLR